MNRFLTQLSLALLIGAFVSPALNAQDVTGPEGSKIYVTVSQNREIAGTPIELTEIKVTTSFGEVAIPLAKIDGIKMHADSADSAVIAFKNGDLVTGKVTLEVIKLKTAWGTAHVNTAQIDTVTASRTARFFSDSSGQAKGWRFSNNPPAASSAPMSNGTMSILPAGR
jgi:hypothetical protein